jgi:hypothetical protein
MTCGVRETDSLPDQIVRRHVYLCVISGGTMQVAFRRFEREFIVFRLGKAVASGMMCRGHGKAPEQREIIL